MVPLVSRIGAKGDEGIVAALTAALAASGINLIGATPVEAYDATVPAPYRLRELEPAARSAIVAGNGGGAFWNAFREFCRRDPAQAARPDPVDGFTRHVLEGAVASVVGDRRVRLLYPFRFPA